MTLQANFITSTGTLECVAQCGSYVVDGSFTGPSINGTISDGTGTYDLVNTSFFSGDHAADHVAGTYTGKKGDFAVAGSFLGFGDPPTSTTSDSE